MLEEYPLHGVVREGEGKGCRSVRMRSSTLHRRCRAGAAQTLGEVRLVADGHDRDAADDCVNGSEVATHVDPAPVTEVRLQPSTCR
jgi:hypothetical protein